MVHGDGAGPHGVDEQGFVDLLKLRAAARRCSQDEFEGEYPVPALLMNLAQVESSELEGKSGGGQLLTLNIRSVDYLSYAGRVGLLVKRPGNPFPRMVSLGRGSTNDLVLDIASISNFHGFFEQQDGTWYFKDHNSTNGTWLNGDRLAPDQKAALSAGDRLRLGLEIEATFLPPLDLYRELRD